MHLFVGSFNLSHTVIYSHESKQWKCLSFSCTSYFTNGMHDNHNVRESIKILYLLTAQCNLIAITMMTSAHEDLWKNVFR